MSKYAVGFMAGIAFVACGAPANFLYKDYTVAPESYSGRLLGAKPEDDLDFKLCEPTETIKDNCHVFLKAEFDTMKEDYLKTKSDLIACQKGRK